MSEQNQQPFKWRHFQPDIILLCVRWYLRYAFKLSRPRGDDAGTRAAFGPTVSSIRTLYFPIIASISSFLSSIISEGYLLPGDYSAIVETFLLAPLKPSFLIVLCNQSTVIPASILLLVLTKKGGVSERGASLFASRNAASSS